MESLSSYLEIVLPVGVRLPSLSNIVFVLEHLQQENMHRIQHLIFCHLQDFIRPSFIPMSFPSFVYYRIRECNLI